MKKTVVFAVIFSIFATNAFCLSAKSCVVLDVLKNEIVYEKNGEAPMLFASTTKIMTAMVALELYDVDTVVKVKDEWTGIEGSSMYLKPGESVSVLELLYGLMLNSGNDAAVALASIYNGSPKDFVTLMNAKAIEIGAFKTFFENPNGLDGKNHKTTAEDLAVIAAEALKNPVFRKIAGTQSIKIGDRYFSNHNKLLRLDENIIGIKTGFTKKAGRCLVSAYEDGGRQYIIVTLNAPDDWNDHLSLYRQYGKCGTVKELVKSTFEAEIPVAGTGKTVTVCSRSGFSASVLPEERVEIKVRGPRFIYGNREKGDKYGEISIFLDGKCIKNIDLIYKDNVKIQKEKRNFITDIWEILKNYRR